MAAKLWISMDISSKEMSNVYLHKSKQAIIIDIYLNQCINNRLVPFIEKHYQRKNDIFWTDKGTGHYATLVIQRLPMKNIKTLWRNSNFRLGQWSLLEQKIYAPNWQANHYKAKVKDPWWRLFQSSYLPSGPMISIDFFLSTSKYALSNKNKITTLSQRTTLRHFGSYFCMIGYSIVKDLETLP